MEITVGALANQIGFEQQALTKAVKFNKINSKYYRIKHNLHRDVTFIDTEYTIDVIRQLMESMQTKCVTYRACRGYLRKNGRI